jgi:hypothetical protein
MLMGVYGAARLLGYEIAHPSRDAQVPRVWQVSLYPGEVAMAYGVGLGLGVLTRISSFSFLALLLVWLISNDAVIAMATACIYGAARAWPVLEAAWRLEDASAYQARTENLRERVRKADAASMLVGATVLLAVVL